MDVECDADDCPCRDTGYRCKASTCQCAVKLQEERNITTPCNDDQCPCRNSAFTCMNYKCNCTVDG